MLTGSWRKRQNLLDTSIVRKSGNRFSLNKIFFSAIDRSCKQRQSNSSHSAPSRLPIIRLRTSRQFMAMKNGDIAEPSTTVDDPMAQSPPSMETSVQLPVDGLVTSSQRFRQHHISKHRVCDLSSSPASWSGVGSTVTHSGTGAQLLVATSMLNIHASIKAVINEMNGQSDNIQSL